MSEEEGGCKPFFKGLMNVCVELKPCPFCGKTPILCCEGEYVKCMCFPRYVFEVEWWNTRAKDKDLLDLAISLVQDELVTVGKGADIAGMSYYEFEDELRKRGVRWKE